MAYLEGINKKIKLHKIFKIDFIFSVESSILESIFLVNQNKNQPLELKVDNLFFLGSPVFVYHNTIKYNIIFAVKVIVLLLQF